MNHGVLEIGQLQVNFYIPQHGRIPREERNGCGAQQRAYSPSASCQVLVGKSGCWSGDLNVIRLDHHIAGRKSNHLLA